MRVEVARPQSSRRILWLTSYDEFQTSFPSGTNQALGERILSAYPTVITVVTLRAETRTERGSCGLWWAEWNGVDSSQVSFFRFPVPIIFPPMLYFCSLFNDPFSPSIFLHSSTTHLMDAIHTGLVTMNRLSQTVLRANLRERFHDKNLEFLAYFPKTKVGLSNHQSVCVSTTNSFWTAR